MHIVLHLAFYMVAIAVLVSFATLVLVGVSAGGGGHPGHPVCPQGTNLELISGKHHKKCECVGHSGNVVPFNHGCSAAPVYDNHWTCKGHYNPSPSHKPRSKRDQMLLAGAARACPPDTVACPITRGSSVDIGEVECIHSNEDLENCGGCSSLGLGVSCGDIAGVRGTSCVRGKCEIYSCSSFYELVRDVKGSKSCVIKDDMES